jgi:hypothetical protein
MCDQVFSDENIVSLKIINDKIFKRNTLIILGSGDVIEPIVFVSVVFKESAVVVVGIFSCWFFIVGV